MLNSIREEFRQCTKADSNVISSGELTRHWQQLTEEDQLKKGHGLLSLQDKHAIKLRVQQMMNEMDIKSTGAITMEEWVHYMLLAQSKQAAIQINSLLKVALQRSPQILKELQQMFEVADQADNGLLSFRSIMEMYSRKLWHLRPGNDGRPLSGKELEAGDPDKFARDIIQEMDLDGDARISYAEFMAYCVGRRKQEVTLHLYDISNGLANKISPYMVSKQLEGLWHSGLCVFGKEYFFSRDTVFDEAGGTSFGKPKKVINLGVTLWRQSELHKYIVDELKPVFHRETYDIVQNNCNHFTDRLCLFLLGKHLPEEVLEQTGVLTSSTTIRMLRPVLNWWLRDGVVARVNEKNIEAEAVRQVVADKALKPGTVVRILPAGEASGTEVLGVVSTTDGQMSRSSPGCLSSDTGCGLTPRWDVCGCSYPVRSPGPTDKASVEYFDLSFDNTAGTCRGQLRTELFPRSRLQVESDANPTDRKSVV